MNSTLHDAYLTERELARRRALDDPEFFAKRYLSHYLTVEAAEFHRELYSYMRRREENPKPEIRSSKQIPNEETPRNQASVPSVAFKTSIQNRHAFAAPRGHAKSTIVTLSFALWALCTGRKRLIVLVSDTAAQAEMFLDDIRHELEHNADLRDDFGEMVGETWRRDQLQTRAGAHILAKGTGAGLRGLRSGSARPDLIICDDIENDENTATPEQRQKVWRWFSRTLINTLEPNGALWVIGTILHHDSLLANLVHGNEERGIEKWPGKVWRALEVVDAETTNSKLETRDATLRSGASLRSTSPKQIPNPEIRMNPSSVFSVPSVADQDQSKIQNPKSKIETALWPSMWSVEKLLARKKEIGTLAFAQEFQNEPCGPEDAIFKSEWLEHPDAWYDVLPKGLDFFQAVDPAISTESSADYFCHVTVGRDPQTGDLYIADIIRARMSFDRQVAVVIDQANRWRPVQVAIESVAYQAGLADAVTARAALPIIRIQSPRDKVTRALRLSSIIENHKLKLRRSDPASGVLRDELLQFPHGSHDDQIDALGYAAELATARVEPRLWVL